jgi:hypothetical protein
MICYLRFHEQILSHADLVIIGCIRIVRVLKHSVKSRMLGLIAIRRD